MFCSTFSTFFLTVELVQLVELTSVSKPNTVETLLGVIIQNRLSRPSALKLAEAALRTASLKVPFLLTHHQSLSPLHPSLASNRKPSSAKHNSTSALLQTLPLPIFRPRRHHLPATHPLPPPSYKHVSSHTYRAFNPCVSRFVVQCRSQGSIYIPALRNNEEVVRFSIVWEVVCGG